VILVDTNVLSEALKPAASPAVVAWLNERFAECVISSITIFELAAGVALLNPGRRREVLEGAIARLVRRFGRHVYAFDTAAAYAAARLAERARAQGLSIHQIPAKLADLQIGGIASAYGLLLATRNIGDFQGLGLELVDPWAKAAP
jgi:predicted nucleic acid-binding protein